MYSKFIQSNRLPIPTERLKTMKQLIKSLPAYHNETLQFLIRHLKVIADHSDENKVYKTIFRFSPRGMELIGMGVRYGIRITIQWKEARRFNCN